VSLALLAAPLPAQQPTPGVVVVPLGQSVLLPQTVAVERVSIGTPDIADYVVVSPLEVLVTGARLGTTTLIIWNRAGGRRTYTVEVTVDASALGRTMEALFPQERLQATAVGSMVILTGTVSDARVARQVQALAAGTGATVINNLVVGADQQVLLQVRIAEVSRSALREFSSQLAARNPQDITGQAADWSIETLSDGLMRLMVLEPTASIDALFRALRTTGEIRTLAEPTSSPWTAPRHRSWPAASSRSPW
jgi:Flp pilus assembly secretin CpaC